MWVEEGAEGEAAAAAVGVTEEQEIPRLAAGDATQHSSLRDAGGEWKTDGGGNGRRGQESEERAVTKTSGPRARKPRTPVGGEEQVKLQERAGEKC